MNQGIFVIVFYGLITLSVFSGLFDKVYSQNRENPLYLFEKLIEGEWKLENSIQTFEWGIDKMSVKAKSYILDGGEKTLTSEGFWYWHPGKQEIEGIFTATNMPAVFFDYSTTVQGDSLISDLVAYDKKGNESKYAEIIYLSNENSYNWSLMQDGVLLMEGVFRRQ